jgi:hypothetical protein
MAAYPRRPSYSIFVRFRRSRLALRRGIAREEDALAIAEELRAGRFHDQGDVFVVKEPEGTVLELPPLPAAAPAPTPFALPSQSSSTPPSPIAAEELIAAVSPESVEARPMLPPPPRAGGPPRLIARDLASILRLVGQVRRFGQVIERARAAHSRLDRACAAAERALLSHPGPPPAALRRSRERLVAMREAAALAIGSYERAGALVARNLDAVRADVAGAP